MWSFFSEARVRQLSVFWSVFIIGGLFVADTIRSLPSIGIAGLFLTSVGYALHTRRIAQRARWPQVLCFWLIYLLHATTGLWHSSLANVALRQDLVLQLPFLLLPAAFLLLPDWLAAHKRTLWLVLIGSCLVAAAIATNNYLLHDKEINQIYLESRVMPTKPDHIRFSLLVTMAVLAGAVLFSSEQLSARLRSLLGVVIVALFLFQHLLAVRSGLVTLYLAGALWLVWQAWQLKQWKAALVSVVLVGALGGASMLFFPTLQNKIINTRIDTAKIDSVGAANNFSVTGRVYSYQAAWAIINEHPVWGVSKVKLANAMAEQYGYLFPEIEPAHYLLPHNQFLFNLAAYGIVGLLVFLVGFYYPLGESIRTGNILQMLMYLTISLSFLVEYTLESQIGVLTGLFFILLAGAPVAGTAPAARSRAHAPATRLASS
jgi:O-antigen ligase